MGVFASVSFEMEGSVLLLFMNCFYQMDDEPFNPEYTMVDRVLDVATQVEPGGEVGHVCVCVHIYVWVCIFMRGCAYLCVGLHTYGFYVCMWKDRR